MDAMTVRRGTVTLALAGMLVMLLGALGAATAQTAAGQDDQPFVLTTDVIGVITPVIADHLADVVARGEKDGAEVVVIVLDTPGGLVSSMRLIVQTLLEADVPVAVYVSPRGADAGSAGTYITMAAHIAAMAPATTIGAATPVDLQGGEVSDKVENNAAAFAETIALERGRNVDFAIEAVRDGRSITVDEAVRIGAVDLRASDLEDLLSLIDGRDVLLANGRTVTINTAEATVQKGNLSGVRSILQRLADPNLAFIFLSIATLAIIYEIASPGLGAGGVVGITLIILAMFSLSVLPVNYAGAALMILAGVLFVMEMFIPGVGVAAAGGSIALVLGGLFLFQRPTGIGIDLSIIIPTALVLLVGTVGAGRLARRTLTQLPVDNAAGLIGRVTTASLRGDAVRVRIDGTWWRTDAAASDFTDGQPVTVTAIDELTLSIITNTNTDINTN